MTLSTVHKMIKLSDILPNPYRNLSRLPLQPEKVKILTASIDDTGFWENIMVRPSPTEKGKYELCYGHHRLQSAIDSGIIEAVFIVTEMSNENMVKVMSNENMAEFATGPNVLIETVTQVRDYLNICLAEDKLPNMKDLYPNQDTYKRVKEKGVVGVDAIERFLGKGWSRATVARIIFVINAIELGTVTKQAVLKFSNITLAQAFIQKCIKDSVKKSEQGKLANTVVNNKDTGISIKELLKPRVDENTENIEALKTGKPETPITPTPQATTSIESDLKSTISTMLAVNKKMKGIVAGWKGHEAVAIKQFTDVAKAFIGYCEKIGIVVTENALIKNSEGKTAERHPILPTNAETKKALADFKKDKTAVDEKTFIDELESSLNGSEKGNKSLLKKSAINA